MTGDFLDCEFNLTEALVRMNDIQIYCHKIFKYFEEKLKKIHKISTFHVTKFMNDHFCNY